MLKSAFLYEYICTFALKSVPLWANTKSYCYENFQTLSSATLGSDVYVSRL